MGDQDQKRNGTLDGRKDSWRDSEDTACGTRQAHIARDGAGRQVWHCDFLVNELWPCHAVDSSIVIVV
jgi:hypothetical protein